MSWFDARATFVNTPTIQFVLISIIASSAADAYAQPPLPRGTVKHLDMAYVDDGSVRQKLDLYLPVGATSDNQKTPLVVWIHGGGWAKGSKAGIGNCGWVLGEGYALASVGYRLTDEATFPAQLDDCRAAIAWLRKHADDYGIDADRVVVWGSSAGGHLTSMVALAGDPDSKEDDISGAIDWFGPAELLSMQRQRLLPTHLNADAPDSFESRLVGGTLQEHPDVAQKASPISYVSSDDPPMLIMHGDQDALVPLQQSEMLHAALRRAGVSSRLHVLNGAGHGGKQFGSDESRRVVRNFLGECFD